jgi:hypothetical protein
MAPHVRPARLSEIIDDFYLLLFSLLTGTKLDYHSCPMATSKLEAASTENRLLNSEPAKKTAQRTAGELFIVDNASPSGKAFGIYRTGPKSRALSILRPDFSR